MTEQEFRHTFFFFYYSFNIIPCTKLGIEGEKVGIYLYLLKSVFTFSPSCLTPHSVSVFIFTILSQFGNCSLTHSPTNGEIVLGQMKRLYWTI